MLDFLYDDVIEVRDIINKIDDLYKFIALLNKNKTLAEYKDIPIKEYSLMLRRLKRIICGIKDVQPCYYYISKKLVRDDYLTTWVKDTYHVNSHWLVVDWEKTADNLKQDCKLINILGNKYWLV